MDSGGSTEENTLSSRSSSVDFNAKIGPRRTAEKLHIGTHGMEWNVPGERLPELIMSTHTIHGNETPRPPSTETTSLPLRVWEDSVIDNTDEEYNRLVEHLHDSATKAESLQTKMSSLRRLDGTVTASRSAMEKVIYDFYSDHFNSHVYLPTHHIRQDE
uniref:Similar to n=1 Tax=Haemonchus contortus TaxID=6289 RepID=A0A7I4XWN0_HAECO